MERQFQQEKEDHERKFEAVISLIGAFTLPFVVVGGLFPCPFPLPLLTGRSQGSGG